MVGWWWEGGEPVGWLKSSRGAEERGCTFSHRGESRFPRLRRSRLIRPCSRVHLLLTRHPRGSLRCPPPTLPTSPHPLNYSPVSCLPASRGSHPVCWRLRWEDPVPRGRVEVLSSISTYVWGGRCIRPGSSQKWKIYIKKKKKKKRSQTGRTAGAGCSASEPWRLKDLNHSRRRSVQARHAPGRPARSGRGDGNVQHRVQI